MIALGRKNYLFSGSDAGGERAAAIYSLIETVRLNGLDRQAYLADVVARIGPHPARHLADPAALQLAARILSSGPHRPDQ